MLLEPFRAAFLRRFASPTSGDLSGRHARAKLVAQPLRRRRPARSRGRRTAATSPRCASRCRARVRQTSDFERQNRFRYSLRPGRRSCRRRGCSCATSPSSAVRSAFLAAWAAPRSRSRALARSTSPAASTSARRQSIIGALVSSRSALISSGSGLIRNQSACLRHCSGDLVAEPLRRGIVDVLVVRALALGLPFDDRVGNFADHELDGADGVVVSRNRVVDLVRIAVRVDHRDDRDLELARFQNRDPFLLGIDDEEGVG